MEAVPGAEAGPAHGHRACSLCRAPACSPLVLFQVWGGLEDADVDAGLFSVCPWLAVCGQQAMMAEALGIANAPAVWVCPASCSGWVPLAAKLIRAGSLVVP